MACLTPVPAAAAPYVPSERQARERTGEGLTGCAAEQRASWALWRWNNRRRVPPCPAASGLAAQDVICALPIILRTNRSSAAGGPVQGTIPRDLHLLHQGPGSLRRSDMRCAICSEKLHNGGMSRVLFGLRMRRTERRNRLHPLLRSLLTAPSPPRDVQRGKPTPHAAQKRPSQTSYM